MISIIFIVFSGLISGWILSKIVKGEVKAGKKYFNLVCRIILLFLALIFFYKGFPHYAGMIIPFIVGVLVSLFFKKIYFYLGLGLLFPIELVIYLVFIFGLFYGSLKKLILKNIIVNLVFFLIPLILYFFIDLLISYDYILFGFLSGALFTLNSKLFKEKK